MSRTAAPGSHFAGWVNVWATDLELGTQSTSGRLTAITVNEDGTVDAKWSRSPRVQHYPVGKFIAVWTGYTK